jgi:recombination protein RecA
MQEHTEPPPAPETSSEAPPGKKAGDEKEQAFVTSTELRGSEGSPLEAARRQIEKQFGEGSLIRLGESSRVAGLETIPSGAIMLDEALGIGGYPRGRIIEIYGPESSGKTTLALHAIAEAQKLGGIAAFVDAEHALDPVYAKNLGVNIKELWVSQPDSGEQALEITESLVRTGAVDVIVVDSVAALTPQAEIDGDMGDPQMGLQARLMSQAMRKLTAIIGKSRTILIFINQIRMKIGIIYGNPETTTGGNALKFYASVRLEVRKFETIEGDGNTDAIGNRVRVKVVKNKVAPPFKRVELEIIFGKGVSASGSLLDGAVKYSIIDKKGAWFSMGGRKNRSGPGQYQDLFGNSRRTFCRHRKEASGGHVSWNRQIWRRHLWRMIPLLQSYLNMREERKPFPLMNFPIFYRRRTSPIPTKWNRFLPC